MDAGMIGNVCRTGFAAPCRGGAAATSQACKQQARATGAATGDLFPVYGQRVGVLSKSILLSTTQHSRICSVISNPRRAKWLPKPSIKLIP